VLYPIGDALHLVHGPVGCAAYTWDIRGALSSGMQLHRNSFNTDIRETEVIFGGEKKLARALRDTGTLFLCVPRHAERRQEVRSALEAQGIAVRLRSEGIPAEGENVDVLLIDSTGELRDWTAHADVVIIGKSFLSTGGQNPAEAILAAKPVIVGPHMENFEPLVTQLLAAEGVIRINDSALLAATLTTLLHDRSKTAAMCERALHVLQQHAGATARSIAMLENQ
jgi:3-deoxy-D-manno-octulosonic-acid transferase